MRVEPSSQGHVLTFEEFLSIFKGKNRLKFGFCFSFQNSFRLSSFVGVFFAMSLSNLLCRGHVTRSPAGKVLCPVLRVYTCPVCTVIGDNAHTSSTAPRTGGEVFKRAEIHRKYASGKGKLVLVYS